MWSNFFFFLLLIVIFIGNHSASKSESLSNAEYNQGAIVFDDDMEYNDEEYVCVFHLSLSERLCYPRNATAMPGVPWTQIKQQWGSWWEYPCFYYSEVALMSVTDRTADDIAFICEGNLYWLLDNHWKVYYDFYYYWEDSFFHLQYSYSSDYYDYSHYYYENKGDLSIQLEEFFNRHANTGECPGLFSGFQDL